ncbi:26213_t:CDS:2 [Gigaspora margarita]|uniref:26213_t:CDS:1 n=1 Tax=Gigaspora margarita TaxID=4874 RepID=A0ABN7VHJ4_GIGMA|nr:26213_t:CDS:2 [Gigaspora margarita]
MPPRRSSWLNALHPSSWISFNSPFAPGTYRFRLEPSNNTTDSQLGFENGLFNLCVIRNLQNENSHLQTENSHFQTENFRLQNENSRIQNKNILLKDENSRLQNENSSLKNENIPQNQLSTHEDFQLHFNIHLPSEADLPDLVVNSSNLSLSPKYSNPDFDSDYAAYFSFNDIYV